jgi:hypothetical protein
MVSATNYRFLKGLHGSGPKEKLKAHLNNPQFVEASKKLIAERKKRASLTRKILPSKLLLEGSIVGTLVWGLSLADRTNLKQALLTIGGVAALTGANNVLWATRQNSREIKKATKNISELLSKMASKDVSLAYELAKKEYAYINGEGELVLTNRPRVLGVGRIRISTKEIIDRAIEMNAKKFSNSIKKP